MKYLVKPGDVLVSEEDGVIQAYLAASWAKEVAPDSSHAHHKSGPRRWEIPAWSYGVDGTFYIKDSTLEMELDVRGPEDKVDLRQLNMMPIQYTALETSMALQERGKNYWRCCEKRLVSYYGDSGTEYIEKVGIGGYCGWRSAVDSYDWERDSWLISKLTDCFTCQNRI
jgi:hypothetical protein